jgi:hypothetical protein
MQSLCLTGCVAHYPRFPAITRLVLASIFRTKFIRIILLIQQMQNLSCAFHIEMDNNNLNKVIINILIYNSNNFGEF